MNKEIDDAQVAVLTLVAELCRIYAQDESEKANIEAVNAIKEAFQTDAAALFYVNGKKEYKMCLAGTTFPIALTEDRWRLCVDTHARESSISRFGSWSMPGIEIVLPRWISARLYESGDTGGFIFLGRAEGEWTDSELTSIADIRTTLAPIIEIRYQRDVEEHKRQEAEMLLKKNEARLRDLFEGSRDMIYTADSSDTITGINAAGPVLLGLSGKSEAIGRKYASFALNPDDRALFLNRLSHDGYVDDYEMVLTKPDGTAVFCLETAHTLKDENGNITEIQGIVKDITQRIESERDLWKTNLELAEANLKLQKTQVLMVQHEKLASIGQLAAGVAHEINNPLGFLVSNQNTLEKYHRKIREAWNQIESSDDKDRSRIQRVFDDVDAIFLESQEGFQRIMKIVGSLKNFSRVDQSGDYESYDVNAGIESTLVVAWNEIKYVAEVVKSFSNIPAISANGSEINQVILNIVVNAAQAIAAARLEKMGRIEIATNHVDGNVVILIKDNGPGIPEDMQNKIFDPFFTTKGPGKGTGLGLSISYDIIVNKHKGKLWVDSKPGFGTTFGIELPIERLQ